MQSHCGDAKQIRFGTIYFGVKDNGDVIGHNVGKDTLSTLADRIKHSIKPSVYPTISPATIDDKTIIAVTFSGKNKPYAYKGEFYIRVEQQNLLVDPLVLRELIKEGREYNDHWENELSDYGIDSIDEAAVDAYYRQAVSMGRINKFEHTSEKLLSQLGLIKEGRLTNAGLYLFGKNCPLVFKAVEYPTTERLDPIDLKRFEGNIFSLINDAVNFINQKMRWKVDVSGLQRSEKPEISVVAIREVVINSLVHSDYHADSEHQITVDPENIEIYNPGPFGEYTPIDYVKRALPSRTKHKVIQGVIFKAFDVGTLGRGLKRMDVACKKDGVEWDYCKYNFGFSLTFKRKKTNIPMGNKNVSEDAKKILKFMSDNDGVLRNSSIAVGVIEKSPRTVHATIKELLDADMIERIGSNKNGHWELKRSIN